MNTLMVLAMLPFLSTPYTSSDIVVQDEVYNRVHEYEHKLAWNGSFGKKLNRLKLVKIIDYENNLAWLVDEESGLIVREDIYIQEQKEKEMLQQQYEEARELEDSKIAATLHEGGIYVTDDGRIIRGRHKPVEDNRSYIIHFEVSDDNVSSDILEEINKVFSTTDNLSVVGFASPDGTDPKMQIDLAFRRLQSVSKILENAGYTIKNKLGVVCGSDIERSSCWRVDIKVYRGSR